MSTTKYWNPGKYPTSLLEAILLHGFLISLGYDKKDIFLVLCPDAVIVTLKFEGKEFPCRVGKPEFPREEMEKLWQQLIKEWNKGGVVTDEDAQFLWRFSKARQLKDVILRGLLTIGLSKGLDKPNPRWN